MIFIFPLDFLRNVCINSVQLHRRPAADSGIRQHLDRGHGRFQLVRRHSMQFLPGIVDDLHSAQQLVEASTICSVSDNPGTKSARPVKQVADLTDHTGYALKGHNQDVRERKKTMP